MGKILQFFKRTQESTLSDFVHPFRASKVDHVTLFVRKEGTDAHIHFGKIFSETSGEHRLKAKTLDEAVAKVKAFLEALDD